MLHRPLAFDPFLETRKRFSTSNLMSSNIDDLLNKAKRLQEQTKLFEKKLMEEKEKEARKAELLAAQEQKKLDEVTAQEKREQEEPFLEQAFGKINGLMDKQEKVEVNLIDRLEQLYKKMNPLKAKEMYENNREKNNVLKKKIEETAAKLEPELKDDTASVSSLTQKINTESSGFKKNIQALQKEEEEVYKEVQKTPDYVKHTEKYETEREDFKEKLQNSVRLCREEKKNINSFLESRLEKPSELAQSLAEEMGPDYGGGDD